VLYDKGSLKNFIHFKTLHSNVLLFLLEPEQQMPFISKLFLHEHLR